MHQIECSLRAPEVEATLARLHAAARGDWKKFLRITPRYLGGLLRGRKMHETITPEVARDIYMPVSPEKGEFLYITARAIGARHIVEFGSSFGISTIYLAAAARDNGGRVVGTEIEPAKQAAAEANLRDAGLGDVAEVRLGDALQTLREPPAPVDLVFMDGWKVLYLPLLKQLRPHLRPGAVILADNIRSFRGPLVEFLDYLHTSGNGFHSVTLSLGDGLEYAVFLGGARN
ncbi:MAG: methyltransferase [Gammaproteobacteria bacterium]|nr:MAG: methyltransferase [Gammaproteobacteria bacterium]